MQITYQIQMNERDSRGIRHTESNHKTEAAARKAAARFVRKARKLGMEVSRAASVFGPNAQNGTRPFLGTFHTSQGLVIEIAPNGHGQFLK